MRAVERAAPPRQPVARPGVPRRHADPRQRPEGAVRHRVDWGDGRQYRLLCYSDIVPLLEHRAAHGQPPAVPPAVPGDRRAMRRVPRAHDVLSCASPRGSAAARPAGFFTANAILLWVCAAAIATCLYVLGGKALWFVLAPTLLIYGFMNWDLFAVALATGALVAFARRRDGLAGVLLGLGAAAKFYPALLLVPLIAQRLREREPDAAITDRVGDRGNVAPGEPAVRDRLARRAGGRSSGSTRRDAADWDSLWYIGCRTSTSSAICGHTSRINVASLALFVGVVRAGVDRRSSGANRLRAMEPRVPDARPVPVVQQGVLAAVRTVVAAVLRAGRRRTCATFVAFEIADVAVFVTRFSFFGELTGCRRPAVR